MRVRRDRMLRHYNDGTYRRIEAEIAMREEQERRFKELPQSADPREPQPVDTSTAEEKARAASAALRGEAA